MDEEKAQVQELEMTGKLDALNNAYSKRFWELRENIKAFPTETYNYMCKLLDKQYKRDYALLDGEEGIKTDKQIAELEIKRLGELGETTLLQTKQKNEQSREEQKLKDEKEIAEAVAAAEKAIKLAELVPDDLPKRWWQRFARPNRAKELSMQEVEIIIGDYFAAREEEIATLAGRPLVIAEILKEMLPQPRGWRARKRWEQDIMQAATALENKFRHRAEAQEQLDEIIREADGATAAEAFEEPQGGNVQEQAQPRKRTRKRKAEMQEEESEQLAGQVSLEELGQADKPE